MARIRDWIIVLAAFAGVAVLAGTRSGPTPEVRQAEVTPAAQDQYENQKVIDAY